MELKPQQIEIFRDALLHAYDESSIIQMLLIKCNQDFNNIVSTGPFKDRVFNLIRVSIREGWTQLLVRGAHEYNPGNPKLRAFAQQFLAYRPEKSILERIVRQSHRFQNISLYRERLGYYENQICSIEIGGEHEGTGFLIGPDILMTCYHVIEEILNTQSSLTYQGVRFHFDYRVYPNGQTSNEGNYFSLADDPDQWLLAYRPYSSVDTDSSSGTAIPNLTELDYALLRLQDAPGYNTYGQSNLTRGWINLPQQIAIHENAPITIIQHPAGRPLELAYDSFIGFNANRTRLMYNTNTEPGSSGSPCFDVNLQLVGMHHSGVNAGIPIDTIWQDLTERGFDHLFTEEWHPQSP